MKFADQFREKYRAALRAARANDQAATLKGLSDLYQLFAEQYSLNNGDSMTYIRHMRLQSLFSARAWMLEKKL